jgi:hypothetical protein
MAQMQPWWVVFVLFYDWYKHISGNFWATSKH